MRKSLLAFVSLTALAPAQDHRDAVWKTLQDHGRLIELQWRRDAAGDLEYAPAAKPDAPFQKLFPQGLQAFQVTGVFGPLSLLLHSGDVLALTDGERHFQRLGLGTRDDDLVGLVRAPRRDGASDVEALDRLVAIDVLRRRDTAATKAVLTALAADATQPAAVRTRAAGAAPRERLDPASLPMPATADWYLVIDHGRLPEGSWLVDLGHFTSMISSATVLTLLKQPLESDYLVGETESLTMTELPFEMARRLGNFRLDHTCIAAGSDWWSACSRGRFETETFTKGSTALGLPGLVTKAGENGARMTWTGGAATLTAAQLLAHSSDLELKPRADVAARLLRGEAAVRLHLPQDSQLLELLPEGLQGIQQADVSITFTADRITVAAELGVADAPAVDRLAKAIKQELFEQGPLGWLWLLAIGTQKDILRVEPGERVVRITLPLPRDKLPTREQVHAQLIKQYRNPPERR